MRLELEVHLVDFRGSLGTVSHNSNLIFIDKLDELSYGLVDDRHVLYFVAQGADRCGPCTSSASVWSLSLSVWRVGSNSHRAGRP